MTYIKDIIGVRFGKLVVVRQLPIKDRRNIKITRWECICDCGNTTRVNRGDLQKGDTRSCGCLSIKTHGKSTTREYSIWNKIKNRCDPNLDPNNHSFSRYAGRGIKICAGWRDSFLSFLADMGESPTPKHSVDRMDNDRHYSCGHCAECVENKWKANCRWVTVKEQNSNKSSNRWITYKGESKILADWGRTLNISPTTLGRYIKTHNNDAEKGIAFYSKKMSVCENSLKSISMYLVF